MVEKFTNLPDVYEESVEKIASYPSGDEEEEYIQNSKKFISLLKGSKRIIWVGTGRQEEIADFATRLLKAHKKPTYCSKDTSIPYEYNPGDLVVALSSSGETERTVHYAESAYRPISESISVVSITTNPDSTIAKTAGRTDGFTVKIPGKSKVDHREYQERQFLGDHGPLTLGGTLGELYSLGFIIDSLGSAFSGENVIDYHKTFWDKILNYEPDPDQFERLYEYLPKSVNYGSSEGVCKLPNKTIVGGMGLSGVVARTFAIRLAHCAEKEEERRVNYYKDASSVSAREGDLAFIVSGSGQRFWAKALKPIKNIGGKIAAMTSFEDSPLGKIADISILIPGRKIPRVRGKIENPPGTPERALFEIRSLMALESFIHLLVEKEGISIDAVEEKHPDMT